MRSPSTPCRRRVALVTTLAATVGLSVVASAPALAGDREVARRGGCSGSTDWKVKAKDDDGRIEVEAEIDSFRNGQSWRWTLLHNGSVTSRGTKSTRAPSGSFEVRRVVVDLGGGDRLTIKATNPRSGETCRGSVTY